MAERFQNGRVAVTRTTIIGDRIDHDPLLWFDRPMKVIIRKITVGDCSKYEAIESGAPDAMRAYATYSSIRRWMLDNFLVLDETGVRRRPPVEFPGDQKYDVARKPRP